MLNLIKNIHSGFSLKQVECVLFAIFAAINQCLMRLLFTPSETIWLDQVQQEHQQVKIVLVDFPAELFKQ